MDPSASTRIQLCGRLVVLWEGTRVEDRLPGRQGRLLFAYMAVQRKRPTTRPRLIDAVWPTGPPAAADSALSALLSKLRATLGRDAITGKDEPRLVPPPDAFVDVDAASDRLHEAESAVALGDWHRAWAPARAALHTSERGFLPGADAPWVDEVRRSLEEVRTRALVCVADVGVGLGGPELAAAERAGRALIESDPLNEAGYLHLMRALAERDDVAEAVRVYERLRTRLRDELGIGPSRRARELHAQLLASR